MDFEAFVTHRLTALARYAAVLTGDRDLAKDVLQEVLIRAHARWRRIDRLDHPEAYVKRMVINEYLSWRRRRAVRSTVLAGDLRGVAGPAGADHATASAERSFVLAQLAKLPPRQRAVLVLRYYEGLTDTEIADVLGCAAGTVRGHASRALAALRLDLVAPAARGRTP